AFADDAAERDRIAAAAQELGVAAADRKSKVSEGAGAGAGGDAAKIASAPGGAAAPHTAGSGPSRQDVEAAAAMAPADRTAMIRGMVDGLASRLERSPHDADGWIKLIRSRVVLGEGDLAKQALDRGLAAFADDAAERDRIAAAAQQLGVAQ
ncbi:MAG: hypothetical protein FWD12_10270, partial [Alphaproteobacteria bacterium]|nr:hypothetical protein [Alphaproteobacteria bacterium]